MIEEALERFLIGHKVHNTNRHFRCTLGIPTLSQGRPFVNFNHVKLIQNFKEIKN